MVFLQISPIFWQVWIHMNSVFHQAPVSSDPHVPDIFQVTMVKSRCEAANNKGLEPESSKASTKAPACRVTDCLMDKNPANHMENLPVIYGGFISGG